MSEKILIAEDNENNRKLISDILVYYGYEVVEAKDGAEAVEMVAGEKPDLILMDIQMPVMDGLTALKIIRNDLKMKGVKIIALTSFAMKGDRERFLKVGFDDYITKPIDTRILPGIVKNILAGKR
ncbi:MAG: response regulator [Nitrospirae bacterium]|nr:MAG: response regulator [Nitrospirota bacterium]